MKQNLKKKIVIDLSIVGVGVLIMWIVLFAPPKKELVVTMNELPRLDGSEGTSIAYPYIIYGITNKRNSLGGLYSRHL